MGKSDLAVFVEVIKLLPPLRSKFQPILIRLSAAAYAAAGTGVQFDEFQIPQLLVLQLFKYLDDIFDAVGSQKTVGVQGLGFACTLAPAHTPLPCSGKRERMFAGFFHMEQELGIDVFNGDGAVNGAGVCAQRRFGIGDLRRTRGEKNDADL